MTEIAESPTWDELDSIAKGRSVMDMAEEIWRLRHDLARAVANHAADLSNATHHPLVEGNLDTQRKIRDGARKP